MRTIYKNLIKDMEKVIITGADGFVGSYTVQHFLNNGKKVLALDMGSEARRLKEHKNLTYKQCDITNIKAMQDILGHADAETTLQIYADATKELKKSELINFEDYFNALKEEQENDA